MIIPIPDTALDETVSVWLEASLHGHSFIEKEYWLENASAMRDVYLPNSDTWIFTDSGKVVGFYSKAGDILAALFVLPEYHGNGVGSRLLDHAKEQVERLELTVYADNLSAIAFYQNRGFVIHAEQMDERTGHIEHVMVWEKGLF